MPTLAGNKQLFHQSLPPWDALFHLSTENGQRQSVRDGHQSVYSRADVFFTVLQNMFPKWKRKEWSKIKNMECMTLNILANINNHRPHVHFINNNSSLVLTLWK